MSMRKGLAVLLGAMLAWQAHVYAAEYFVTKQGNDANNGTSRETAFLTIQKGVDALKPGDTLTIGPGESRHGDHARRRTRPGIRAGGRIPIRLRRPLRPETAIGHRT